jgi:hypothetical protein
MVDRFVVHGPTFNSLVGRCSRVGIDQGDRGGPSLLGCRLTECNPDQDKVFPGSTRTADRSMDGRCSQPSGPPTAEPSASRCPPFLDSARAGRGSLRLLRLSLLHRSLPSLRAWRRVRRRSRRRQSSSARRSRGARHLARPRLGSAARRTVQGSGASPLAHPHLDLAPPGSASPRL